MTVGAGPLHTWTSWLENRVMVKYALTGLSNTLVDFSSFALLIYLGVPPAIANIIAFLAGCVNSYIVNRNFTFRSKAHGYGGRELRRIVLFSGVTTLCVAISWATFHFTAPMFGAYGAKICSMFGVLAVGYFLNRTFVFRLASRH